MPLLRQMCNLIPCGMVPDLARQFKADVGRVFNAWSHVVCLIYAQVVHAAGLNDVCDGLTIHSGPLSSIRGAKAPARNTLSHANRTRDVRMAEALLWAMIQHLGNRSSSFLHCGRRGRGPVHRFTKCIHLVDSTTVELVANCIDWAKHRRRKAAAKVHMRLNLQSFLPSFVIVDTARHNDALRARELCAGLKEGEIVVFDKAYLDFDHLADMSMRGVFWVTRTKENLKFKVKRRFASKSKKILADEEVELFNADSLAKYPETMRRVRALVEVDGVEREMEFLSNGFEWSAGSVADLYRSRWSIEVFFKQIKQNLQLGDFLGNNANAVRWQVWMALLAYVLAKYLEFESQWSHSFSRLMALLRSGVWLRCDLMVLLRSYGTAGGNYRSLASPEQAYFPAFMR